MYVCVCVGVSGYVGRYVSVCVTVWTADYVVCVTCRNADTTLTRDSVTRLYFVQCDTCSSRRSVAPIKSGYHAANRSDRRRSKNVAT